MKTLYLDCGMGAAGDMLAAALLDLLPPPKAKQILRRLNALPLPGVRCRLARAEKCGIQGNRFTVTVGGAQEGEPHCHEHPHEHPHEHHEGGHEHPHEHPHEHRSPFDIESLVMRLGLPPQVERNVIRVYTRIARAEGKAHGVPVSQVHFHEVGALDAVADITAVCLLMDALAPEQVIASPVHVGSGQVQCAHGLLPVPAPATAYLLRGVPIYGGTVPGELCTPTGAALLRQFVGRFGPMPPLRLRAIGYGMGTRDFAAANCVRALLGETSGAPRPRNARRVCELLCQVDDMTGEEIGFACEQLRAAGALDVYTIPIGMKKSRPGIQICVLCPPNARHTLLRCLFRHTSTLGVRERLDWRYELRRKETSCLYAGCPVRRKDASGYGVSRAKYEYDDLARAARALDRPLSAVRRAMERAGK